MIFCDKCGYQNKEDAKFCKGCGDKVVNLTESGALKGGVVLDKRYAIKRKIKAGGMGAIYLAVDMRFTDRHCAVKEMRSQTSNTAEQQYMIQAFQKEAEILHVLRHPNLPVVLDYFIEHGRYYLVMDFVEGHDLSSIMEASFPVGLPEEQVIPWAIDILDALDYLHNQNPPIVYRDLKPGNIMIRNSDNRAILVDFGIARKVFPDKQTTMTAIGTPVFASEEMFYGKAEPRSDIYSMGATMHCLLAGEVPLVPFSFKPLRKVNPVVSEELEEIVMQALSQDIDDRFQTAEEMENALENLLSDKNVRKKKKQNSGFLKENQTLKSSQLPDQQVKDKTSVNLKNLHSTKSMAYPSQALIADVKELTTDSGRNINKIAFIIAGIVLIFILLITGSIWYITSINPIYYIYMAKKEKGKNNPSAIKYCKKALNINNNPEFHKVLLDIYMTDEQYYEAAKKELDIMKDVENNDENIETYLNGKYFALGNKFYTLKKYHLAVECFEKLKLDSININTDIIKIIAQSYINTNNKKEAINFYIKRINKLTETEKDDKSIESIYYLDEIIKLEIDDSHIEDLFKIAQKYKNYKKTEEAIKIYTVLKEKEIAKAEASLELGDIYYYQKEYDKAISNYTTAKASLSPKNSTKLSHVKSQLVECYIAIEDYSKALNLLKSIIKNGDTSKKSRFYKLCITLGDKYYTNGNIKKAVEYYTEVDKNSSEFKLLQEKLNKYAENYLKKAYDYKEKKSYEEGKKYCNKILSLQNFIKPEHKDKAENYLEEIEEATRPVQPAYTYPYNGSTPNKPYEPNPPPDNHPNPINPLN